MRVSAALLMAICITTPASGEVLTLRAESNVNVSLNPDWYPSRLNPADIGLVFSDRASILIEYDTEPVTAGDGFAYRYSISDFRIDVGRYRFAADRGDFFVADRRGLPTLSIFDLVAVGDDVPEPNFPFQVRGVGINSFDEQLLALEGAAPTADDSQLLLESDVWWNIGFGFMELSGEFDTISITPAPASATPIAVIGLLACRRRR